jgi:hypothetical protein
MTQTNEDKHRETYLAAEEAVRRADPAELARRAGVDYTGAGDAVVLEIPALGARVPLGWPSLEFGPAAGGGPAAGVLGTFPWRLIALHYLAAATGEQPGEDWISYRELPDGLFYANTITREVEEPLAGLYRVDPAAFVEVGSRLSGQPAEIGDAAVVFHPLPRVPVVFALWAEDEEFPAKVKVMYERRGAKNLPLQDLRILADLLGALLKREAPARR